MCFLTVVYHFYVIKFKWKRYKWHKNQSRLKTDDTPPPMNPLMERWKLIESRCHSFEDKHKRTIKKFTSSNTLEHFITMAVIGWFIGTVLTMLHFYSNVNRGDADIFWCFVIRFPLLVLITLSIAFTETGRCIMLLVPLQLCSKSGNVYIHGTVILLITSGPLMNLKHNLNVIQESSSCQQKGVAEAAAEIADILFGPFSSFKQAAIEIVNGIKTMVNKLQIVLASFKRTVMAVADAIQDATRWINSKINGCKNTVGNTFQHCMDAFSMMYDECKVHIPSLFVKMCAVTDFASNLCHSVKPGEYLCDLVYFNVNPLITTVSQRIKRLLDRAYTLMYFSVNIHHEFYIDSNSRSITDDISKKIKSSLLSAQIVYYFINVFELIMFIYSFCFIWYVFQYRLKYMRRDKFDNNYISERLKEIDDLVSSADQESIFPLRRSEKKKYIKVCTFKILKKEGKTFSFFTITTTKTCIYLGIIAFDYLLYYVSEKCRIFMLAVMQSFGSRTEVSIVGSGFLAELSRRVVRALNYMDYNFYQTHFMPCIPHPRPPNNWTNYKIYFLLVILWSCWLMQPYILRLRHTVMDFYRPDIAERRARWLYNHILFKRMTFFKAISTKLKEKYGSDKKTPPFSIAEFLRTEYPWFKLILGKGLIGSDCMICQHIVPPLYSCPTNDCAGIYCDDCYINIQGVCCICKQEMMHDDFKDKGFKRVVPDKKETPYIDGPDEAKNLFRIVDEDEDLDFSYQSETVCHWGACAPTPRPKGDSQSAIVVVGVDKSVKLRPNVSVTSVSSYKELQPPRPKGDSQNAIAVVDVDKSVQSRPNVSVTSKSRDKKLQKPIDEENLPLELESKNRKRQRVKKNENIGYVETGKTGKLLYY